METARAVDVISPVRAKLEKLTAKCEKHGEVAQVNSKGRTFIKGCALSHDLQTLTVDEIVRNGGNINTGYFPGKFSDVANTFKVSGNTVKKKNGQQRLHTERTIEPRRHGGGNTSNLTQGDLQFIETVKRERPTLSLRELYNGLNELGDIPNRTYISGISRAFYEQVIVWCEIFKEKLNTYNYLRKI